MQIGQNGCREPIDPPQQVVRRDHLVEAELVKQLPLISVLPPHHRRLSCRLLSRNHCSLGFSTLFSTASTHSRTGGRVACSLGRLTSAASRRSVCDRRQGELKAGAAGQV